MQLAAFHIDGRVRTACGNKRTAADIHRGRGRSLDRTLTQAIDGAAADVHRTALWLYGVFLLNGAAALSVKDCEGTIHPRFQYSTAGRTELVASEVDGHLHVRADSGNGAGQHDVAFKVIVRG